MEYITSVWRSIFARWRSVNSECECVPGVATCPEHEAEEVEEVPEFGELDVVKEEVPEFGELNAVEEEEILHCSDEVTQEVDVREDCIECSVGLEISAFYEPCWMCREAGKQKWRLKRARLRQIAKASGVRVKRIDKRTWELSNGARTMKVDFVVYSREQHIGLIKFLGAE